MNCFNHYQLISVGVCQDCLKGLCFECASKYNITICSQCNGNRIKMEKSKIQKELVLTFGIGVLFAFLYIYSIPKDVVIFRNTNQKIVVYIMAIYAGSSFFAGWKSLDGFTSRFFLFLPIIGWIIYFSVKIIVSMAIGQITLPIHSFKNVKRLNQLKKIPI